MVRPVDAKWRTSQGFGSFPTAGVVGNWLGSTVQRLVAQYGNYQPFGHAGEDIACPIGTPVYAMADGVVVWADWGTKLPGDNSAAGWRSRWYFYKKFPGILTLVKHPQLGPNAYSAYAHLSDNDMAPVGTKVRAGQLIALSGNTGGVAPHLHVEYLVDPTYRTGGGLIYGRKSPAALYGIPASLAPASGPAKPTTPKKDWFDMASKEDLREVVHSVMWAYKNREVESQDAYAILRATRDAAVRANAEIAALKTLVAQLADKQGVTIDYDKIDESFRKALAEGTVRVNVEFGADVAETPPAAE